MEFKLLQELSHLQILISACLIIAGIGYYFLIVSRKPKIYSGNKHLVRFIKRYVFCSTKKYKPNLFFWGGRLQTIFGLLKRMPTSEKLPYEREILKLNDGGKVALDLLHPSLQEENWVSSKERKLIVIILPGLTSSSQTSYVKTIALSIVKKAGASVAVLNSRGLGGVPLETPRTFCATNCDDLREAIVYLRHEYPNAKLMGLGTSLGGMILAHYLTEHPDEAKENLITAMVVSAVWDAWSATHSIEQGMNVQLINYPLAQSLLQLVKKYQTTLETQHCINFSKILRSKTLRQFDENYTAPHFGYKSLEEYYDHVSVSEDVNKFSIPVVGLSAYDDPMQPGKGLPIKGAKTCANFALVVTSRGGHLGFLEGWLPKMKKVHFMEKFIAEYVKAVNLFPEELFSKVS